MKQGKTESLFNTAHTQSMTGNIDLNSIGQNMVEAHECRLHLFGRFTC